MWTIYWHQCPVSPSSAMIDWHTLLQLRTQSVDSQLCTNASYLVDTGADISAVTPPVAAMLKLRNSPVGRYQLGSRLVLGLRLGLGIGLRWGLASGRKGCVWENNLRDFREICTKIKYDTIVQKWKSLETVLKRSWAVKQFALVWDFLLLVYIGLKSVYVIAAKLFERFCYRKLSQTN